MLFDSQKAGSVGGSVAQLRDHATRIAVPARRLRNIDGIVYAEIAGVWLCVGRTPPRFADAHELVVTSAEVREQAGSLWIVCCHCHEQLPLETVGLRFMATGTIRNQPRCGPCRSYRSQRP